MGYDGTLTPESLIHTEGIKTAAILAALFNAASKIGHGEKNPGPETITQDQAKAILKDQPKIQGRKIRYFDYLHGKRLKINLAEAYTSGIVASQYDFYYGRGTAKRAIEILKATGDPCHPDIIALQATSSAATTTRTGIRQPGTVTEGNLAEALELSNPPSDEELKELGERYGCHSAPYLQAISQQVTFDESKKTPCTTIDL